MEPLNDDDLSNAATVATCDAGQCSRERIALVLTPDHGWLPMCSEHTITELSCTKCLGDKQIADSEDGEPWSAWASLPYESALAVRMGVVRPITCPECNGTGLKP
jgi:hypothetical protein